jgi:Mce-associated membrane protein
VQKASQVADDSHADAEELAREAEAEAVAAETRAVAARARVQDLQKRREVRESKAASIRQWRVPRPTTVLTYIALTATCALLAVSGYLVRQDEQVAAEQKRRAEFTAAAGQAVVTLMSIDSSRARDDVQRIIDDSTGQFRDDIADSADEFVQVATDSKSITKASVRSAAVESMTDDSATVLVTASTTIANEAGVDQQPRTWRLSVDVVSDGGQIKMSKVDFVQ